MENQEFEQAVGESPRERSGVVVGVVVATDVVVVVVVVVYYFFLIDIIVRDLHPASP